MKPFHKSWHIPLGIRQSKFFLIPAVIIYAIASFSAHYKLFLLFTVLFVFLIFYCLVWIYIILFEPFNYRLNDYFIVQKFWLSKYGVITQKAEKNKVRNKSCSQVVSEMSSQKDIMINQLYSFYLKNPNVVYLTTTHDTIRKRLKKLPNIKILVDDAYYERDLIKIQSNLVGRKCKKCIDKDKCKLHQRSQKRTFYYMKFIFTE